MSVLLVPHDPIWSQQYKAEAERLLRTLGGWAWEGGVVCLLEHVGSTSIPGIMAKPCIDIALGTYPFPLEASGIQALEALGYIYKGETGISGRQYFQRGPHDVHLHVCEAGGDLFTNYVLFRDYLRVNQRARKSYEGVKLELAQRHVNDRAAYTEGKAPLIQEFLQEAHAWHIRETGFKPVAFVQRELGAANVPWCVASGWALDLFLGRATRLHHDLDVCIWRKDQQLFLKHLKTQGWNLQVPVKGKYRPWQEGEFLELPITQIHAHRDDMPFELLDILLAEHDETNWIYRREPKVTMPKEAVMFDSSLNVLALNPAIILLFKSRTADKDPREKDQQDFEHVLPHLSQEQKEWLLHAFDIWMPEHPWRNSLKMETLKS
jgi:GrpB-like predicted nucleotidyltransferase (UPF0157 family)